MNERRIETTEARERIADLKNLCEELETLVKDLETQFLSEFGSAYDSTRAQELKADIDAMKVEIDNINKETATITTISSNYVVGTENTDETR